MRPPDAAGRTARHQVLPALAVLLCSAAAAGGSGFPWVMPNAFLIPGAALLVILAVWALWRRKLLLAGAAVTSVFIAVWPIVEVGSAQKQAARGGAFITVAHLNVHEANEAVAAVAAVAKATGADVLSLQEVDEHWYRALQGHLASELPYHFHAPAERNYGIALFSKYPLDPAEVLDLAGLPALRTKVSVEGKALVLISAHLRAPESASKWQHRNRQWELLAQAVRTAGEPVCLVGDLNTVPWDPAFKQFERATGLWHGTHAWRPTWPSLGGISCVPLDHVLTSAACADREIRSFNIPGSDHRGLVFKVVLY